MAVKLKRYKNKWYLFIDHDGKRKSKCVGKDRKLAETVQKQLEAKLLLGGLNIIEEAPGVPTFGHYADVWMKEYARIECKTSTANNYNGVLGQYLRPRFENKRLDQIARSDIKAMIGDLAGAELSRNTIRNAICVIRGIYNYAIENGVVQSNPASRIGKFTRFARDPDKTGVSLTSDGVQTFLDAAAEYCPDIYPVFLTGFRAGLRRGELVALRIGDLHFGKNEEDPNRYILVQHNYVLREHTSTKSKKARRVDMSKDLRAVLLDIVKKREQEAHSRGVTDISNELVFQSPEGKILDPDNLYHRYFLPALKKSGIRKIRLHDLRHTFGSLLIQAGASLTYVKEQMGHSSIQVTVDTYGHLVPGANVSFVDKLDAPKTRANTQPDASQTQPRQSQESDNSLQVVDLIGGGGRTRTYDLRIMRPSL